MPRYPLIPSSLPRGLQWLAWGSMGLAVVVLCGLWPPIGGDLLMHLTVGQWIVAHGEVPRTDPMSYVAAGRLFIAHSWLAEVLFYAVERMAGTVGFMLLRFALITLALGLALQTARQLKATWPAITGVSLVVLTLVWGRLECRPMLFSTLFLAGELWLLMRVHLGRHSWRWLWGLPPLYAVWINLHGGWPQGLIMLVAMLGALITMDLRGRWGLRATPSHLPWRALAFVLLGCVAAVFVNPYGARLVVFPLEMEAGWIRRMGPEWQSPFTTTDWSKAGGRFLPQLMPLLFYGYLALLVRVLMRHLTRWRDGDLVPVAVLGVWGLLACWHVRAVLDAVVLTAPYLAASLAAPWRRQRGIFWGGLTGLLALTTLGLWLERQVTHWRWTDPEPRGVVAFVQTLPGPVRVWSNDLQVQLWLVYRLPGHVWMPNAWEYVLGPEQTAELQGPSGLALVFRRHLVTLIVLQMPVRPRTFAALAALHEDGWALAYTDDRYLALVRSAPQNRTRGAGEN